MKTYHDYTELSQKIHAPEQLKARVLQASLQGGRRQKRTAAGRYSRGWSVAQKAAAAAILLAVCLPVTAYAAVKGLGLKDKLAQWGMQDIQAVEDLSVSASEISGGATEDAFPDTAQTSASQEEPGVYSDRFANYSFVEAILDSKTIYVAAKITPLDSNYLLIPYFSSPDEVFTIDGVTVGTAEEYAASQGKEIVYVNILFDNKENPIQGAGYDCQLAADGSVYYFFMGENTFGSKEITMQCRTSSYTKDMDLEEYEFGEFEVALTDKSTVSASSVYTVFDSKAYEETGIRINDLTIEETEMGLYTTFTYAVSEAKCQDVFFKVVDASGKELAFMPGLAGTVTIDNGNGTFSRTNYYQKPANQEGLQFVIYDFNTGTYYGPYSFGE